MASKIVELTYEGQDDDSIVPTRLVEPKSCYTASNDGQSSDNDQNE